MGSQLSQTEVVTLEIPDHMTVERSCDQIGSKSSYDPSRDQVPDLVPRPSNNESDDKEHEHMLMCYCQHLHQPRGWLGAWVSHENWPL